MAYQKHAIKKESLFLCMIENTNSIPQNQNIPNETPKIIIKKESHWRELLHFAFWALLFGAAQFLVQYLWLSKGILPVALVRSGAFAGASFIGLALFSSAIFKWYPRTARYWRIRRYLGVWGFIFTLIHILTILIFYVQGDISKLLFPLNPLENPRNFGLIAFVILFVMTLTSTDFAVAKLKPKVWKTIHRFIYPAYIALIFHFVLTGPDAMLTPPGYLLIAITFCAVFGQMFWFFKTALQRRFKSLGTFVGFSLIALSFLLLFLVFRT
jgi:DMSO/TMAO reductase YedYZ heme-binding membrane subunit